ncbi:MAG: HlyD family secretion protein [Chitinispirillaceae bacterium]
MQDQKNRLHTVDAHEAKLKNQKFTDQSETFLKSPPSFILRGPIYLVLVILIAAVIYSTVTQVSVKVTSYMTVRGEEYIIQSPVNGTVNLIYQNDNSTLKTNEKLLTIYSQSAFSKETNLAQISHKKTELHGKYRQLRSYLKKIDSLADSYARKNKAFDLKLPEYAIDSAPLAFTSAEMPVTKGNGEFELKYSGLQQNIVLLQKEYDRAVRTAKELAITYRENARLLKRRYISRQEYLGSEQAYRQASSEKETITRNFKAALLAAYEENYQTIKSVIAELEHLEHEAEGVELMLAGIEISGNSLILKNRYPGVITDVYVKTSQMISEGMPLMRIIRNDYPLVGIVNLPVSQIGKVKTGQKVAIRYDAFPFQIFGIQKGEIVDISDDVKQVEGQGYAYEVAVALENNPKVNLKPGMGGMAEIITGKKRIIEVALAPASKIFAYLKGEE